MNEGNQPLRYGAPWTRDELILAFDLYCRIPFKKTKANQPEVIELARLLNRSPASVARKLGNFGSFDPELQKRQISGLVHTSKLDKEVWIEFNSDWNRLVLEAKRLQDELAVSLPTKIEEETAVVFPQGASEKEAIRKNRIHQAFFRDVVLSSYEQTCCVTGIKIRECLIASHIVPWSVSEQLRADPRNGLCLSATFDRLFDRGLMTLSGEFEVVISSTLRETANKQTNEMICCFHGAPLIRPRRFMPLQDYLDWHRHNVFHD